jgi:hypothetical protein
MERDMGKVARIINYQNHNKTRRMSVLFLRQDKDPNIINNITNLHTNNNTINLSKQRWKPRIVLII